jgi:hypothetical protein
MPTYCVQCGVEHHPRTAVGVDEDGQPACAGHAVTESVKREEAVKLPTASAKLCHCGARLGHKGRHRSLHPHEPQISDVARRKNGVTLRQGLQEVLDQITAKSAELNGKIEALTIVLQMLDQFEKVGRG